MGGEGGKEWGDVLVIWCDRTLQDVAAPNPLHPLREEERREELVREAGGHFPFSSSTLTQMSQFVTALTLD